MKIQWNRLNRKVHYWGAIICAIPVLIIIVTGVILLFKKEIAWIQPKTVKGNQKVPTLTFDQILEVAKTVPEGEIESWKDVDRLDVRPGKGMLKLRAENSWEIQIDTSSGEVLQVAYRRSDFIESIHDGSFFHDWAKLGVFLPSALILLVLWVSGIYLFLLPVLSKRRRKKKAIEKELATQSQQTA